MVDSEILLLKMIVRAELVTSAVSFSSFGCKLSRPADLLGFRPKSLFSTSSLVICNPLAGFPLRVKIS